MRCDIYFNALKQLSNMYKDEIHECDEELSDFAYIYSKKLSSSQDTAIDKDIERTIKERKKEAQNELGAIKQGLLDLECSIFGTRIPDGIKEQRRKTGTINFDPACFERDVVGY